MATYPPAWPFQRPGSTAHRYNLTEAIRLRSAAHAFEGKVLNIVASCLLDDEAIVQLSQGSQDIRAQLETSPAPASLILGPNGDLLRDSLVGREGMVVADIDSAQSIEYKEAHDIVGHYNRFDIFHFEMKTTPNIPIWNRQTSRDDGRSGLEELPEAIYTNEEERSD